MKSYDRSAILAFCPSFKSVMSEGDKLALTLRFSKNGAISITSSPALIISPGLLGTLLLLCHQWESSIWCHVTTLLVRLFLFVLREVDFVF